MWKRLLPTAALAALLVTMFALMLEPMHEDTATNDEPLFLGAGYLYWTENFFRFDPEQPPLSKEWSALPLLGMNVKLSDFARGHLDGRAVFRVAYDWRFKLQSMHELFPNGSDDWYYWPFLEGYSFGYHLLYDKTNDAEALLFAGRLMQALLTLAIAAVLFLWARQLAGPGAGLLAAGLWVFNPIALAYGHLVITDMGATLTILLAVWAFAAFLQRPTPLRAALTGCAVGCALLMKFTALLLGPMCLAIALVAWWRQPAERRQLASFWKLIPLVALLAWIVLMLGYAPHWTPAPYLDPDRAARLRVPGWFQSARPLLVPPDFFKSLALQFGHAQSGHEGFLLGRWRLNGWWYYYPVALAVKTPIPLLLLMLAGLALLLKNLRRQSTAQLAPWIAGIVYLAVAMTSTINIGIRHLLPMIALVTLAAACQFATAPRSLRFAAWTAAAWLAVVAFLAHPLYIQYFNEFAGGSAHGYRWLIDSNLDWGQDVKRLKRYLDEHHIGRIYQDYFGPEIVLNYYDIPNQMVSSAQAFQLHDGILVISATRLFRPEWGWLRKQYLPIGRVADTIFIFDLSHPLPAGP